MELVYRQAPRTTNFQRLEARISSERGRTRTALLADSSSTTCRPAVEQRRRSPSHGGEVSTSRMEEARTEPSDRPGRRPGARVRELNSGSFSLAVNRQRSRTLQAPRTSAAESLAAWSAYPSNEESPQKATGHHGAARLHSAMRTRPSRHHSSDLTEGHRGTASSRCRCTKPKAASRTDRARGRSWKWWTT